MLTKRVKFLRNEKIANEAKEVNEYANRRQVEELYRSFNSDNSSFKAAKTSKKCDPNKLKEFFERHFTSNAIEKDPIELEHIPDFMEKLQNISIADMKVTPPDEE